MNSTKSVIIVVVAFVGMVYSVFPGLCFGIDAEGQKKPLTFEQRLEAQRAIEQVFYQHRLWPDQGKRAKPPFEELMPDSVIRAKVTSYLKKTFVLNEFWDYRLTGRDLQREMARMARESRDPRTLKELFAALNNDPCLIAECLARPFVADRLIRQKYAFDPRIHGESQKAVEHLRRILNAENFKTCQTGDYREVHFVVGSDDETTKIIVPRQNQAETVNKATFDETIHRFPQPGTISFHETSDAYIFRLTTVKTATEFQGGVRTIRKMPFEEWFHRFQQKRSASDDNLFETALYPYRSVKITGLDGEFKPDSWQRGGYMLLARTDHTAVWTGTEMIVWGGTIDINSDQQTNTGGRYNPVFDTWEPTSIMNSPAARADHTAVWTGTEMIIWGGYPYTNTGGRYIPQTDTWTGTNCVSADTPTLRRGHTAVWTGESMIVWGGYYYSTDLNTGARYNPTFDSWKMTSTGTGTPLRRHGHTAIWCGNTMIVWGGFNTSASTYLNTGSRFIPDQYNGTWSAMDTVSGWPPTGRADHAVIWDGQNMIMTGGRDASGEKSDRKKYDPQTNVWNLMTDMDEVRADHTAIWTGTTMLVWGGTSLGAFLQDGLGFGAVDSENQPEGRTGHTAVWTGTEMIIWGGQNGSGVLDSGGRYNPNNDLYVYQNVNEWVSMSSTGAPSARQFPKAVWTGVEMIVWGGLDSEAVCSLNSGGRYLPAGDIWMDMTTENAPEPRYLHAQVWTGNEMVVWAGYGLTTYINTGGRYDPWLDTWKTLTTVGAPVSRSRPSEIWTGSEMIVWGGYNASGTFNTGGRYNPQSDTWQPTSLVNVPQKRNTQTTVWTGSEMIVWGGYDWTGSTHLNTGGRYDPATDTWMATSTGSNVPSIRRLHSAVWSGTEMLVWGGRYASTYLNDGSKYDPVSDTWTLLSPWGSPPEPRENHTAVWSGANMYVWGGNDGVGLMDNVLWVYDPTETTGEFGWWSYSEGSPPSARKFNAFVWADSEMIIWGGNNDTTDLNDGGRLRVMSDCWKLMSRYDGPSARQYSSAVWTGNEMIVWGGLDDIFLNTGGRYSPLFNSWSSVSNVGAPLPREKCSSIWTGTEMIVWGGAFITGPVSFTLNSGGCYNPTTDSWSPTREDSSAPACRYKHTAVWAEDRMIVWGGRDLVPGSMNSGGAYIPDSDSWVPTDLSTVPDARCEHSAIWTGTEMIIWGGRFDNFVFNTGSKYNPMIDMWTSITTMDAPPEKSNHFSFWTGDRMIIWGGDELTWNVGGLYGPLTDTWTPISSVNAPAVRTFPSCVWTGSEMVIWGGSVSGLPENTGATYIPDRDVWESVPLDNAPIERAGHTATWAQQSMIIWGGTPDPSLGIFYPNTYPTSDPEILNLDQKITLSNPPDETLNLSHDIGLMTWWDAVEGAEQWIAEGDWHVIDNQNCSDVHDYYSYSKAWYFGDSGNCTYNGPSGSSFLTSAQPFFISDGGQGGYSYLIFRYFLDTDALKDGGLDRAVVEVSKNSGATWIRVATDISHWQSAADGVALEDTCSTWRAANIKLNDYLGTQVCTIYVRFGFHRDTVSNNHVGWVIDDIGVGTMAGDGSNCSPFTTTPYHDQWDQATFEWDLDEDGFPDNSDFFTPVLNIPEAELGTYDLAVPGYHNLTLTVTDSLGLSDSRSVILEVVDGFDPSATVIVPNGGESWTFSESETERTNHLIVWESNDNHLVTRTKLYYNTDNTDNWAEIADLDSTLTHISADTPVDIPDTASATSSIIVTELETILDVDVTMTITHPNVEDLELTLSGPGFSDLVLSSQNGGDGDNYEGTVFDDEAKKSITAGVAPFTGRYKPAQSLAVCDGMSAAGTWVLRGEDKITGNTGTITSWSLTFTFAPKTSYLWVMPTQAEAEAENQTFPSAECKIQVEVFDSSNNSATDESDNNFYIIQPTTTAVKTLILWDSGRIENAYGTAAKDALALKLGELADHNKVSGVVRDLALDGVVQQAYTCWDSCYPGPCDTNPPCDTSGPQERANAVADAIRDYLYDPATGQISTTYTNARYLILVGDDMQIPFYRMQDGTSIHAESQYPGEVGLNTSTTVGSAIAAGYFLSDNFYAELAPEASNLSTGDGSVYLNDLAIGRLVETPDQIKTTVNTFLARDGQVNLTEAGDRVLVTGFDFFYDSACAIEQVFAAQETTDELLDDPEDLALVCGDVTYTKTSLGNQVFSTPPHKLSVINTHAHHFGWAASDLSVLTTTDMTTAPYDAKNLAGTIIYSSGCHSGLPVPAADSNPLDLPETLMAKQVMAYIGNTGYGWGITFGRGLTEKLMEKVSDEILRVDSLSIGNALAQAKRQYYLESRRYDQFDEKVMHEMTLFGIPNTLIVTDLAKNPAKETLPAPDGPDQGCAEGICLSKTLKTISETRAIPPGMTELALNFTFGAETYHKVTTTAGDYYELNGRSSGEVGDTLQPHFVYDSQLSGTNAHGVIFSGGNYTPEVSFTPVVGVPQATHITYPQGPLPLVSTFTPCVRVTYGSGGSSQKAVGEQGYTSMVVHTGYFEESITTQVRFDDLQMTIYYSNASDVTPPSITDPGPEGFHTLDGLLANFTVNVSDASGVYRVLVTYNDYRTTDWKSLELSDNGVNWQGTLSLKGSIRYFVQAIDAAGNVGLLSLTGLDLNGDDPPVPYGTSWEGPQTYAITFTDSDGDDLPDIYEEQYWCLDSGTSDAGADPDYDYLSNLEEFGFETNPCDGDTDGGGDNDGSENANGRDFLDNKDDLHLTIQMTKDPEEPIYTIDWNDDPGDPENHNEEINGYYFVYRSSSKSMYPADLIAGPLPDSQKIHVDVQGEPPPCTTCYYKVWNYQLDTLPPVVQAVFPASGPRDTATPVNVYGLNFQTGATVKFCGSAATNVVRVNESMISCNTPALSAGVCDVTVINPNNQEGTLIDGYTYMP